jgi:hypothetical protein
MTTSDLPNISTDIEELASLAVLECVKRSPLRARSTV